MAKAFEVIYLQPADVHFERHEDTLSLTVTPENAEAVYYPRVVLRSCFPVSKNTVFLSVRDATDDKEIGIIEDWTKLLVEDRDAVATELNMHYFVPQIHRILDVKEELGFLYWTVETDKGLQEFVMRNSVIRYTREVSPGHWLLIDVNEARYEISDLGILDTHSQKLAERFLSI
ncbi:MAG: DUF1854 domain-containing protein [Anaerolineae bacterium]|nr:DUF1854 domain-containing protein [Anaerolineae bacterium]